MQRPWTAPGIGWILAVIVLIVAVLMLLHVVAATEVLMLLMFVGLALALLL